MEYIYNNANSFFGFDKKKDKKDNLIQKEVEPVNDQKKDNFVQNQNEANPYFQVFDDPLDNLDKYKIKYSPNL